MKKLHRLYCRIYPFFAAIMPYESPEWEKQYLFYSLLVKKLPNLNREDFTSGLLETIDFDKYRIQKEEERNITLDNTDATIEPIPVGSGAGKTVVELDILSNIVADFNTQFGGIEWTDVDEVRRQIQDLPRRMTDNEDFVNAVKNGNDQAAQIHFYNAIQGVVASMGEEKLEFMQKYFANNEFQNFINERIFQSCLLRIQSNESHKSSSNDWVVTDSADDSFKNYSVAAEECGVL
jgi:type I restriction enzyme R subunit